MTIVDVDPSLESLRKMTGNYKKVYIVSRGGRKGRVTLPFKINARKFLKFAEGDCRKKSVHYMVNALSNVKRAIDIGSSSRRWTGRFM